MPPTSRLPAFADVQPLRRRQLRNPTASDSLPDHRFEASSSLPYMDLPCSKFFSRIPSLPRLFLVYGRLTKIGPFTASFLIFVF